MKKFYRIKDGKVLAGFCAGLGEYFQLDPIFFRLAFIALTLAGLGLGILFYLIAWILTPLKKT
ncbi:PspC domain-containing protein [bacterium]|nr:PspC domain-containing protein [bacterium]MBU1024519.1 PspC domain-containing protein [bacterium]